MKHIKWFDEFSGALTICDKKGRIVYMNKKAAMVFKKDGGIKLIGSNLFDCHPEPARTKLAEMLKNRTANIYTIEKKGIKKLIYQSPWYEKGRYKGFIELSLEMPFKIPHFVRNE